MITQLAKHCAGPAVCTCLSTGACVHVSACVLNNPERLVDCLCVYTTVNPLLLRSPLPSVCLYSYSLEGLSGGQEELRGSTAQGPQILEPIRMPRHDSDDRGSLVSLTEEQEVLGEHDRLRDQVS